MSLLYMIVLHRIPTCTLTGTRKAKKDHIYIFFFQIFIKFVFIYQTYKLMYDAQTSIERLYRMLKK